MKPIVVYIIECKTPNYFYVGITTDYAHRIRQHTLGRAAAFTRRHGVKKVLFSAWGARSLREAKRLEWELMDLMRREGKNVKGKNVKGAKYTRSA